MKKYIFIILFALSSFSLAYASGVPVENAGFIKANIWYSSETFYAGDTVRVYTAIFNGTSSDLSGSVEFLDNSILIGRTEFDLLSSGKVIDVSVPWVSTEGKHVITARIVDASISQHGGPKTAITLADAQAGESDLAVQVDPAIAAAAAQASVAGVAQIGSQAAATVGDALQTVDNAIPAPIKQGTASGVSAIENLRTMLGSQLQVAKESKGKEIDTLNAQSTGSSTLPKVPAKKNTDIVSTISHAAEKPFAYVTFAVLAILQYFFQSWILFYAVILYVLYRITKWVVQKIRNR